MTFSEIQTEICELVNLTHATDIARVGRAINRKYREITSSLGIKHVSRRTTVSATMSIGVSTLAFTSAEKLVNVFNRNLTPYKQLDEVSVDELEAQMPFNATDTPTQYAIKQIASDSVTILVNCIPQTAFALYADVYSTAPTLSGTDEPAFSESYHDILISAVMIDEYLKLEKLALSKAEYIRVYGDGQTTHGRMGELRLWIAVSTTKKEYQGKQKESSALGPMSGGASGGGGGANGSLSYTQSGLITFDRSGAVPDVPFAVAAGADKVVNLDADKLDGLDSTAFALSGVPGAHATQHKSGGTDPIKLDELAAPTDVVTLNVSSTAHGLAPKSSADATKFLNAAATPAYANVKDSDLALTDVVSNNVTSTAHGFAPKSPADATKFMNGAATPAFALVKDSDLSTSDIVTNDVSSTKHGLAPKSPGDATKFLNGGATPAWSTPPGYMTLLKAGSGTDTTAAATNVDTVAISGLTVKDTILIYYTQESITQTTASTRFYNSTDGLDIAQTYGQNPITAASLSHIGTAFIMNMQSALTRVVANTTEIAMNSVTGLAVSGKETTFTQNWTGSWTLAFRHAGVTAGGTFKWSWSVYKIAGQ